MEVKASLIAKTHKVKLKSVNNYKKSLDFMYKTRYNSIESITREVIE